MNNNILNTINQFILSGQSPQQIVNNMIMQNPQYKMLFNQVQSSGLSLKDFVIQYAKQNNIDIQPILNTLNQRGYKL